MRVLVLHGYTQNGDILRKKLSAIRRHVKGCEFVFPDGPMVLAPSDLEAFQSATTTTTTTDPAEAAVPTPELTARAWFKYNAATAKYDGLEESMVCIRDLMAKERFDGIFGFSQGAGFAALICAMLEKPQGYPAFLIDGQSPHPPVKFCIAVAGFKPTHDASLSHLFEPPITTPILIVLGTNDSIITEERSKELLEVCANTRVEKHDGGHFVPSKASWRTFFRDYIMAFDESSTKRPEDVPSPPAGVTPGTSALGTPVDSRGVSPTHEDRTKL